MLDMELYKYTALELGRMIKEKKTSVKEVLDSLYGRICEVKDLNGYITLDYEKAAAKAETLQKRICKGELAGPLAGVPIAVKDNIFTEGIRTTCGSKMLKNYIPPYSATAVRRLEEAGMLIFGKTNMDEFAMGSTGETSYFGSVKNPWNKERAAGGSSSGSAAMTAAYGAVCALGSDTGGSIRMPAAQCGVTGLKPSYGRVSRYGLVAHASSLEQIGPMGRTAEDCGAILDIIKGADPLDATSRQGTGISVEKTDIKGLKIAVVKEFFDIASTEVVKPVLDAVRILKGAGAEVAEISLDVADTAVSAYYIIACAEAASNLSRFDGLKYGYCEKGENLEEQITNSRTEGFGEEVKRRIILGNFVLSSGYFEDYYRKALAVRKEITYAYGKVFDEYDLILTPAALTAAPKLGEYKNKTDMYMRDSLTVTANLTGFPAITVPCGKSKDGMPVGLQLMAEDMDEATLILAGRVFQRETDFHKDFPEVSGT